MVSMSPSACVDQIAPDPVAIGEGAHDLVPRPEAGVARQVDAPAELAIALVVGRAEIAPEPGEFDQTPVVSVGGGDDGVRRLVEPGADAGIDALDEEAVGVAAVELGILQRPGDAQILVDLMRVANLRLTDEGQTRRPLEVERRGVALDRHEGGPVLPDSQAADGRGRMADAEGGGVRERLVAAAAEEIPLDMGGQRAPIGRRRGAEPQPRLPGMGAEAFLVVGIGGGQALGHEQIADAFIGVEDEVALHIAADGDVGLGARQAEAARCLAGGDDGSVSCLFCVFAGRVRLFARLLLLRTQPLDLALHLLHLPLELAQPFAGLCPRRPGDEARHQHRGERCPARPLSLPGHLALPSSWLVQGRAERPRRKRLRRAQDMVSSRNGHGVSSFAELMLLIYQEKIPTRAVA